MKKTLLLFTALVCINVKSEATNYYFSSSGNDSRTPTQASNPATPWQSISKLNSFFPSLVAGDSVLFYRGQTFSGTIIIQKSGTSSAPIVIGAYGPGSSLPAISGWTYPSSWTNTSGSIWQASCPSCAADVNSVLVNNVPYVMGRYPNKDATNKYLTFESHSGKTQLTDNDLSSSPNWSGADVVVRTRRWVLDRNPITMHSGSTLTFTTTSQNDLIDGYGYFIENSLSTLDQYGEWFFEKNATPSLRKVDIHFGTSNPNSSNIAVSSLDNLLTSDGYNYITICNLNFTGSNKTALIIKNGQNITIKNCYIRFPGVDGIECDNLTTTTIDNNEFYYVNNTAITIPSTAKCNYTTITNNLIEYTGTLPGMGQSGNLGYEGIVIYGDNNTLQYNIMNYTGSAGIEFQGSTVSFKNNFINYFATVKDDVGGIYTWKGTSTSTTYTNRVIDGNIILNGLGAGEGTNNSSYKPAEGIYMDDNSQNVSITNNTVANCGNSGIFSHSSHELTIRKNTVYNNSRQLLLSQEHTVGKGNYIRNNSVTNNIFVSKDITQLVAEMVSDSNDINNFGPSDTNSFCRPLDDKLVIHNQYIASGDYFENLKDLSMWQAAYSKDASSTKSPFTYPAYTATSPGTNKFSNQTFSSNADYVSVYSSTGTISKNWINAGGLDAGTAKISYSSGSSNGVISFAVGAIDVNKKYILKFSLKGSVNNKTMRVYLFQNHNPYDALSVSSTCKISSSRTENEFLLIPTTTDANATVTFEIDPSMTDLYVDNFEFYEATVSMNNPDNYIRFEYNATKNNKNVSLGRTNYKDAKGANYTGNITLSPFTSLVLFKQTSPRPTGIISQQNDANQFILYPNPVNNSLFISFMNEVTGQIAIQITDLSGKLIMRDTKTVTAGQPLQFDTSALSSGTYILSVASEQGACYNKFTKLNE